VESVGILGGDTGMENGKFDVEQSMLFCSLKFRITNHFDVETVPLPCAIVRPQTKYLYGS
jgi:hypothetical protein